MPQSLLLSASQQTAPAKRPRSADDHQRQPLPDSAGQNGSNLESPSLGKTPLKASIKMPSYLQKSRTDVLATFQELEWKQRFRLFHAIENPETSPYRVDRSEVVVGRNRYGNVQPWDASRIKLKTPIDGSDYVNASPIVLKSQSAVDMDNNTPQNIEVKYIATQGPKQGQRSHFWQMVHQELVGDVGVVIMLTQLIEDNKEKCSQYYPAELDSPTLSLSDGTSTAPSGNREDANSSDAPEPQPSNPDPDSITLLSKEFDSSVQCEVRKMRLTINNQPKTIMHYLFGRWPDFGKPDAVDRKALMELSRRTYKEADGSPRVVHCSAGVGRTGTWIALDFLVREVDEDRLPDSVKSAEESPSKTPMSTTNEDQSKVETWGKSGPAKVKTPTQEEGFEKDEHDLIYETVNTLRDQRMMMVIREVQFSFLYDVVKDALLEKYKARPEGAVIKLNTDLASRPRQPKAPRISDDATGAESSSEAETEIMETDVQGGADDDDEDPYSAVSPDYVRRGMSQEF